MKVADTFEFLLGTWSLTRSIHDHRTGVHGSFDGAATVRAVRSTNALPRRDAWYEEEGTLRFADHVGPAHRRLRYRGHESTAVMAYFVDWRYFVDLDLRSGRWSADHPCGDDRYVITTEVVSLDVVREVWLVTGPTTHYRAETVLTRSG